MKVDLPLNDGISLQISSGTSLGGGYPTVKIKKGLLLLCDGEDLSEEAVGFGVPILKRGLQTIFPGEVDLYIHGGDSPCRVSARYKLNLEEKIARQGSGTLHNSLLYGVKNLLAAAIRKMPFIRRSLTQTSNLLRTTFTLETTYETSNISAHVIVTYSVDAATGKVKVEMRKQDPIPAGTSELVMMNEQGAHHFDQYEDSAGIDQLGSKIGCWDLVQAAEASFIDIHHQISFSLPQVDGARLYRGRELVDSRLAWSGFGYSFSPELDLFTYEISIKRLI